MSPRPLSVTLVGWLFVAAGVVGLVYHGGEFRTLRPVDFALVCFVRLLGVVGGAFLLRGRGWARWLLVGWLAYHVALSLAHGPAQLATHAVLLVVITAVLFRPAATAYFRAAGAGAKRPAPRDDAMPAAIR